MSDLRQTLCQITISWSRKLMQSATKRSNVIPDAQWSSMFVWWCSLYPIIIYLIIVLTMSYNEESEPALERNAIAGQSKTLYLTYAWQHSFFCVQANLRYVKAGTYQSCHPLPVLFSCSQNEHSCFQLPAHTCVQNHRNFWLRCQWNGCMWMSAGSLYYILLVSHFQMSPADSLKKIAIYAGLQEKWAGMRRLY